MAKYKVSINTDSYICKKCSKRNREPGTVNDFMIALNGWHTTEHNIKQVLWRLFMFQGDSFPSSEWNEAKDGISDVYLQWKNRRCNEITYFDRLCGLWRTQEICPYGWNQGYFNGQEYIEKLKKMEL